MYIYVLLLAYITVCLYILVCLLIHSRVSACVGVLCDNINMLSITALCTFYTLIYLMHTFLLKASLYLHMCLKCPPIGACRYVCCPCGKTV